MNKVYLFNIFRNTGMTDNPDIGFTYLFDKKVLYLQRLLTCGGFLTELHLN